MSGLDADRLGELIFRVGSGFRRAPIAGVTGFENDQEGARRAGEFAQAIVEEDGRMRGSGHSPLPTRHDFADTFCFLRRHDHPDESNCEPSRAEADAVVRALAARYDGRPPVPGTPPFDPDLYEPAVDDFGNQYLSRKPRENPGDLLRALNAQRQPGAGPFVHPRLGTALMTDGDQG